MKKRSKYDVLEKEYKNNSVLALDLALRLFNIRNKMQTKHLDEEKVSELLKEVLPVIITFANIGYENVKDLGSIVNREELIKFLKQEKIDPTEFSSNYLKNINHYTKLLLVFAILSKETSILPSFKNPQSAIELLGGREVSDDLFNDLFDNLSIDIKNCIKEILISDFDVNEITNYQKELLEEYHDKYMSQNVYDQVTDDQEKPQLVMKLAKSYSKKSCY